MLFLCHPGRRSGCSHSHFISSHFFTAINNDSDLILFIVVIFPCGYLLSAFSPIGANSVMGKCRALMVEFCFCFVFCVFSFERLRAQTITE